MKYKNILIVQASSASEDSEAYVSWNRVSHHEALNEQLSSYVIPDKSYNLIDCKDGSKVYIRKNQGCYDVIIYAHLTNLDERNRKRQLSFFYSSAKSPYKIALELKNNLKMLGYNINNDFPEEVKKAVFCHNVKKYAMATSAVILGAVALACIYKMFNK